LNEARPFLQHAISSVTAHLSLTDRVAVRSYVGLLVLHKSSSE
jgi:hypothetical protein